MRKSAWLSFSILTGLLIFLAQCKNVPVCTNNTATTPSWRGIVPGQATWDEVNNILGFPYDSGPDTYNHENQVAVYESENNGKSRPHRIFYDDSGCVLLISEYRGEPAPDLVDLLKRLGEPEATKTGGAEVRSAQIFIYAEKGMAISGDFTQEPESAYLLRVMYFVPIKTELFLEEWSESLFLGDDFSPHPGWRMHFSD